MIKKLLRLLNVGLLRNGVSDPVVFDRATLIYAENGRGKSTIASVLRAMASADAASIGAIRTIDSDEEPDIEFVFDRGGTNSPVALRNGSWTGTMPQVYVFDPAFVDDNVYSGQEVHPEQRQSLLKFALGNESVKLERQLTKLTVDIAACTKDSTEKKKRIAAFAGSMPVAEFMSLADVPDAEEQIEKIQGRMDAARNAATLSQRALPDRIPQIGLDSEAYFKILQTTFSGVRDDARAAVLRHFHAHSEPAGIEEWVAKGREFTTEDGCPFCGQDVSDAALLSTYDAYFDRAYEEFSATVSKLARGIEHHLAQSKIDLIRSTLNTNQARIDAWKDQVDVESPPFDFDLASETAASARSLAEALAIRKQRNPHETVGGDEDRKTINTLLAQLRRQIDDYNLAVDAVSQRIGAFKLKLAGESPAALLNAIARLNAIVARRNPGAQDAVDEYTAAENAKGLLNDQKKTAREQLDALLPKLLSDYQTRINSLLNRFHAGFSIVKLSSTYTGGPVRSNYALQLRGRSIELGRKTDSGPTFRNVLSEGDKRTLALAFFLARLQGSSDGLAGKVIVFDDPVSSLDANRRGRTVDAITEVFSEGAQVVVLSHDPHFLNDVSKRLKAIPSSAPRVHQLKRVADGYSAFTDCDLDLLCESDYYRRHRTVTQFIQGSHQGSLHDVAVVLRPLVEGFFKRRFPPPMLPRRANLGTIIREIRDAPASSPLALAKPSLPKMAAFNGEVTASQHDDGYDDPAPNEVELQQKAQMALDLIHGDHEMA